MNSSSSNCSFIGRPAMALVEGRMLSEVLRDVKFQAHQLCIVDHVQGRLRTVQCATDLEHLYRIYSIPTHDKHQWLLLQFIVLLIMKAKGI